MKVYFVFNIKNEFINLYQDNKLVLFNIFKSIYNMKNSDLEYASTLFNQLIDRIDSEKIDRDIFIKYHSYIPYSKHNKIHLINNLYKDEVSRMIIRNSYIRVELDNKKTSWFNILKKYSNNFFVCDFTNYDCFFL